MVPKSESLDLEIAEMLEFYQAAAFRSDSHVSASVADSNHRQPSRHSVVYRPISAPRLLRRSARRRLHARAEPTP
jgi:hypothetical protein